MQADSLFNLEGTLRQWIKPLVKLLSEISATAVDHNNCDSWRRHSCLCNQTYQFFFSTPRIRAFTEFQLKICVMIWLLPWRGIECFDINDRVSITFFYRGRWSASPISAGNHSHSSSRSTASLLTAISEVGFILSYLIDDAGLSGQYDIRSLLIQKLSLSTEMLSIPPQAGQNLPPPASSGTRWSSARGMDHSTKNAEVDLPT